MRAIGYLALTLAAGSAPVTAAQTCAPHAYPAVGEYRATQSALHGPGLILEGGGSDIDAVWRWAHATISGGSKKRFGNVVVLRASGTDDYDPYVAPLGPFASVRTIVIAHCATAAQIDSAARYVGGADLLFFSGGDQADYAAWKGSALIAAVRRVWTRGGVEGGTSAGLAIQGEVAYDSVAADRLHPNDDAYEVRTPDALRDPFEPEISFTANMFAWPPLHGIITDTHFARRDRFGRLVAFLARTERARGLRTGTFYGLGIDERSALVVDARGTATLLEYSGNGYSTRGAYLIRLDRVKQSAPGRPLIATVCVLPVGRSGARLDLVAKRGHGKRYTVAIDGGRIPPYQDPY
jgi:cyanophycinase